MKKIMILMVVVLVACGTNTHKMPTLSTNTIKKDSIKIVDVKQDTTVSIEEPIKLRTLVCKFGNVVKKDCKNDSIKHMSSKSKDSNNRLVSTYYETTETECHNVHYASVDTINTLDFAEQMPQFPGGNDALIRIIADSLKFPNTEADVQGKVILRLEVTKTGKIGKIEVFRSLDPLFDKEAIRVVKLLPKFIPGKQNGKNVKVWYTIPITFKLE